MAKIHVVTSGYFNPIHKGHVRLIQRAKELGTYLTVIVNNDYQAALKGSQPFQNEKERCEIVQAIKGVNQVVLSVDRDKTVRETLKLLKPHIFAKGGDSTIENIPELEVLQEMGTKVVIGVGGGKIQSSSWLKKSLS